MFTANLAEAEEDGDLPEFAGPAGSEKEVVARFRDLHDWFAPVNLAPEAVQLVEALCVDRQAEQRHDGGAGTRAKQGRRLKERVDRLVGIYPQLVARLQDRIESVDMRYPNGLALKARDWRLDRK